MPSQAASVLGFHADHEPLSEGTSRSIRPFSICRCKRAVFHFFRSARRTLPYPSMVPPSGFGYPRGGFRCPHPWRSFSVSNAPGLRSSEPSSEPTVADGFPRPLPLSRFSAKPSGLAPAPQRLIPVSSAVYPCYPTFYIRLGTMLS